MNNEILTSEDIDSALKPYSIFKGAFPSDSISMFCLSEKQAFIINTAKSGKPGEHWVGLILDGPICNYFDSFGLEILNLDVLNTLKYSGITKYVFNSNQIQPSYSENCGYYCIAFCLSYFNGITYPDFLSFFSNNVEFNNEICYTYLKK
jgi:hypothetical protein